MNDTGSQVTKIAVPAGHRAHGDHHLRQGGADPPGSLAGRPSSSTVRDRPHASASRRAESAFCFVGRRGDRRRQGQENPQEDEDRHGVVRGNGPARGIPPFSRGLRAALGQEVLQRRRQLRDHLVLGHPIAAAARPAVGLLIAAAPESARSSDARPARSIT